MLSPEINGLLDLLFLLDKGILDSARIDPLHRIFAGRASSHQVIGLLRIYMKSLLEAVAVILLLFLTPPIAAGVLISLARPIESIGDLPIDEWLSQFAIGQEIVLQAEPFLCPEDDDRNLCQGSHF
jgi:hypothetical protein